MSYLQLLGTGTSQGIPVIGCTCSVCQSLDYRDKRLRTSALLVVDGYHLLIDPGPDFRQQALRYRIPRVDAVLITHEHKDHTGGLDELRSFNFMQGQRIVLYTQPRVIDHLRNEYSYVFGGSRYPGIPQLDLAPAEPRMQFGPFELETFEVYHGRLPVLGLRYGPIAYLTDCNQITPEVIDRLREARLQTLVLDCLQHERHLSHFSLPESLEVAQSIGARETFFIHMGHLLGRHADVNRTLPESVRLAHDGLMIALAGPSSHFAS